MTADRLGSEWREMTKLAAMLGFDQVQVTKHGHPRFYNRDIDRFYVASFTPSDWRGRKNAVAEMERMSGRKIPRQKAGKIRHCRSSVSDMQMSDTELLATGEVDKLLRRADVLRDLFANAVADNTRTAASEARTLAAEFTEIRQRLEKFHRIIPPLSA